MNKPKHIFVTSIRQDKRFWGIYIALSWALLIAISIIDNTINSVENPNPVFLLGSLGLLAVMAFLFIRPSKMGWSLVVAVHLVQTFDSMFGAFGVLATAKLDGEHIIGMARNGAGMALGIMITVYLFQKFVRDLYTVDMGMGTATSEEKHKSDKKRD